MPAEIPPWELNVNEKFTWQLFLHCFQIELKFKSASFSVEGDKR